jgi:hypothetical protein
LTQILWPVKSGPAFSMQCRLRWCVAGSWPDPERPGFKYCAAVRRSPQRPCFGQHRCRQTLCMPAGAFDTYEVAGIENERNRRAPQRARWPLYTNQDSTSSSEHATAHDMPSVKAVPRFRLSCRCGRLADASVWCQPCGCLATTLRRIVGGSERLCRCRCSHVGDWRRCGGDPVVAHASIRGTPARPVAAPI